MTFSEEKLKAFEKDLDNQRSLSYSNFKEYLLFSFKKSLEEVIQEQKERIIKSIQGQPCSEKHCILKKRIIDKILETY